MKGGSPRELVGLVVVVKTRVLDHDGANVELRIPWIN